MQPSPKFTPGHEWIPNLAIFQKLPSHENYNTSDFKWFYSKRPHIIWKSVVNLDAFQRIGHFNCRPLEIFHGWKLPVSQIIQDQEDHFERNLPPVLLPLLVYFLCYAYFHPLSHFLIFQSLLCDQSMHWVCVGVSWFLLVFLLATCALSLPQATSSDLLLADQFKIKTQHRFSKWPTVHLSWAWLQSVF